MAWTYNDFESQSSDAARLSRLRLHLTEVRAEVFADIGSESKSRSNSVLVQYLAQLEDRRKELEQTAGTGNQSPAIAVADMSYARGG